MGTAWSYAAPSLTRYSSGATTSGPAAASSAYHASSRASAGESTTSANPKSGSGPTAQQLSTTWSFGSHPASHARSLSSVVVVSGSSYSDSHDFP